MRLREVRMTVGSTMVLVIAGILAAFEAGKRSERDRLAHHPSAYRDARWRVYQAKRAEKIAASRPLSSGTATSR